MAGVAQAVTLWNVQHVAASNPLYTVLVQDFSSRPLRVAIIGSGPSGIFSAEALLKQATMPVQIDVIDRLPTPYGLLRYGVAPDHQTIKSLSKGFEKVLSDPRVRFLGNVEFGKDLTYAQARAHYDALIYTVGASVDRQMNIPGESLSGSLSATEFVAWYNGHPDAATREMLREARSVAVVGLGNVALDVSRILAKTAAELQQSDMAEHALRALAQSGVQDIWILGRRGPAQAKFTSKELREFGELQDAEPVVIPQEIALTPAEEAQITDNMVKKNLELLREFAARPSAGKARRVHFRFWVSPVELVADENGQVSGIKLERNRLDDGGNVVGTGEFETLAVQMVLRSVGYKGKPLPDVPFDERRGVIPNAAGRVDGRSGEYTAGWVSKGAQGVVGNNRKDATEMVALLLQDAQAGLLPVPSDHQDMQEGLRLRGIEVFGYDDWHRLDEYEVQEGQKQGRPRQKVVLKEEMLRHRR